MKLNNNNNNNQRSPSRSLHKNNGSVSASVPGSKLITMSLSLLLTSTRPPLLDRTHFKITHANPKKLTSSSHPSFRNLPALILSSSSGSGSCSCSGHEESGHLPVSPPKPTSLDWQQNVLSTAASLYPLYVTAGGILACFNPSAFSWFVKRGPASYSLSLGLIMLAMGLTLELKDLIALFMQRPLSVSAFP
jgi:BASS family bile acid:Na+ symporter